MSAPANEMSSRTDGPPRSMLWFASDLPNLCSLAGLAAAVAAMYFAVLGVFPAAMIGLIWAVVFDWLDGRIARRMSGRTQNQRDFGAQLDSLIDIVSFGVVPAVVLVSLGDFSPLFLLGGVVYVAAAAVRLAYFNVFGLTEGSAYRGLALDNNALFLVAIFVAQPFLSAPVFQVVVYVALMVLASLNVAPIQTPKLAGHWYYAVVSYALVISGFYGLQLSLPGRFF